MRELLSRVATLPAHSIILFMGLTEDGEGRLFLPQEMLDPISAAANAPTFGWNGLGTGSRTRRRDGLQSGNAGVARGSLGAARDEG